MPAPRWKVPALMRIRANLSLIVKVVNTSISKYFPTWTLMILFLMRDWRNTQTSLTSLNGVSLHYLRRSNSRDSLNWFDLNYYKNSGAKKVLTDLFCMYLSLMVSQVEMQFDMYKWMNSVGNSTTVVSLFTTLKSGLQESTNQKYKNTKVSKSCWLPPYCAATFPCWPTQRNTQLCWESHPKVEKC